MQFITNTLFPGKSIICWGCVFSRRFLKVSGVYRKEKKCKLSGSTSNTEHSLLFFTRIDLVIKIAAFFSHLVKIKETLWHMHHRSFTFSLSKISINFPWIFICFFPRNDCYARRDVAIFWISLSSRSNWNSAEGRKEDIEEEWET